MRYEVTVTEVLTRTVQVEAQDASEAERCVRKMYDEGEVVLTADDFLEVEFSKAATDGDDGGKDMNEAFDITAQVGFRMTNEDVWEILDRFAEFGEGCSYAHRVDETGIDLFDVDVNGFEAYRLTFADISQEVIPVMVDCFPTLIPCFLLGRRWDNGGKMTPALAYRIVSRAAGL